MQYSLGASPIEDIAVALAVPVVAKHPHRGEIVVHGGAVHLSKERIKDTEGDDFYGTAVALEGYTWDAGNVLGKVTGLSQEHGIVKIVDRNIFDAVSIGDMIAILPVHSCLTANLMKGYLTNEGKRISAMPADY